MRVDIDHRGVRSLIRSPELAVSMNQFARKAVLAARTMAPVDSGEYRRRMFARPAISGGVAKAYFGTDSYKGWWVEFGSVNNRAHRTLRIAATRVGMKLRYVAIPGRGGSP